MRARRSILVLIVAAPLVSGLLASPPSYGAGTAATSPPAAAKPSRDSTPPGPVHKLRMAGNDAHSITLAWDNPGGPDFAGVLIRRAAGSTPPIAAADGTLVAALSSPQATFIDKHLDTASTYSYAVFAWDESHNVGIAATLTTATSAASALRGAPADQQGRPSGRAPVRQASTGPSQQTSGQQTSSLLDDPPDGALSGLVTDSASNGIAGILVSAFDPSTPEYGPYVALTDEYGNYTVTGLAAGSYQVCFYSQGPDGASPTGYLDECYADQPPHTSSGTPVAVTLGQTSAGVDATLATGGAITGELTDPGSAPVPGIDIKAWVHGTSQFAGSGHSDSSGAYVIAGLPTGSYTVCLDGSSALSVTAPYGYTASCTGELLPVSVVAGQASTFDDTVEVAGAVGGAVTGGNGPVAGVWVSVQDSSGNQLSSTPTDANGNYRFNGLAPGQVTVCFDPTYTAGGFQRTCYGAQPDGSGSPITVTTGQLSTADVQLQLGASITGTITDGDGDPISGVLIGAFGVASATGYYSQTDESGGYTFSGVTADDYQICFDPSYAQAPTASGYAAQCHDGQLSMDAADPVTVGSSGSVTVDAVLNPGAVLTGQLTDSASAGLGGVYVSAYDPVSGELMVASSDYQDGSYRLPALAGGSYIICFDASDVHQPAAAGYLNECYDDQPDASTATPVTVTAGTVSSGVDAELAEAPPA